MFHLFSTGEEELQGLLQEETALQLEHRELLSLQSDLQGRVQVERAEIERLRAQLATKSFNENSSEGSSSDTDDPEDTSTAERVVHVHGELSRATPYPVVTAEGSESDAAVAMVLRDGARRRILRVVLTHGGTFLRI
uniref:Uncharacterized protein n=1 Tax=Timema shepardi TaxID=629360 RepID=A0A7R9AX73_TIMSH|nr:unnamed protein product [Timema shepardi]